MTKAPLSIRFAHRTFKWSNEARNQAAVYCVIIGFAALEAKEKWLFDYETPVSDPVRTPARQINAYLVDGPWALIQNRSQNLSGMPEMMYGSKPTDGGHFLFTDEEKVAFLASEPGAAKFVKPFLSAHEYFHGERRWVLWLVGAKPEEIRALPKVVERVNAVDQFRKASKAASTREYPYPTLFRQVTQPAEAFVLIPRHSSENRRYVPFGFFSPDNIVADSCLSLPGATVFHLGVIQSAMHMVWMRYTCGRLKSDYRYSKDIVYNNFPWPDPSEIQREAIESAAQGVLNARVAHPCSTLADLYDPMMMPPDLQKAHQMLDRAVDLAYGRKDFKTEAERVAFLFERYQALSAPLAAAAESGKLDGRRRRQKRRAE
jgi:hypothetical protein